MHREILIFSSLRQPISALHRALYLHIAFFIHTINLYIKTTTANKLPQKRIKRNTLTGHRHKIIQELQKPLRLLILRFTLVNSKKQRFRINLQAGKLIHKSRIKHHICFLLERKNILLLASPYRRPPCNGILCGSSTCTCITDNSADQPSIRCGNPVMLINV